MKKLSLLLIIPTLAIVGYSLSDNKGSFEKFHSDILGAPSFSVSPPSGKTGAPGEGNCTDCHLGSTVSADGNVTLTVSGAEEGYVPGTTYDMNVAFAAGTKNSFTLTVLDDSDEKAGTLIAGATTNLLPTSTRDYIAADELLTTSWDFQWTAPSTDIGDLTVYFSANESNSDASIAGDVIYLGQTDIFASSSAHIPSLQSQNESIDLRYNQDQNEMIIDYELFDTKRVIVNVQDVRGRVVETIDLGIQDPGIHSDQQQLNNEPHEGLYIVSIIIGNNAFSTKILVN